MKKILIASVAILLCSDIPAAQELPDDILADQYLLEATEALEQGGPQKALRAFKKIEALEVEPPPLFAYFYGKLLAEYGTDVEALRKGQSLLKQFVISAGRESEYYTPTLKLLSMVEAKLAVVERQAPSFRKVNAQMVRVEGGSFIMGCTPEQDVCHDFWGPAHRVEVRSFEISKYEVTQELWVAVMGENLSDQNCPQCPVSAMWDDVQVFLQKLNAGVGRYRLPSEAEWEYAARGGVQSRGYEYAGSDNPDAVAWYSGNCGDETQPVGQKQANELGLYDLSGNQGEWVQDCSEPYPGGSSRFSRGREGGVCIARIFRGGTCWGAPVGVTSRRGAYTAGNRAGSNGFRIARSLP